MQTIMGKADALASYWTFHRNTGLINTMVDEYLSITKDDIMKAAKKYLTSDNRVVLTYLPKNGKEN